MRPICLKMTAFGPYKNTEIVDFNDLQYHNLFVISGNTGAGKTTIFDGICFALYGSASGEDRENQAMLRSDFADDDVHTAVELLFELKGRTYRILRQLGHVKAGNKTKTGEQYEFYEIIDDEEIPCVDRQIVSEINAKVEELMGLTQEQFKQIVMLPQGEFRKLLTSETENKEEILRRLFKTEPYKQVGDHLRVKQKMLQETFHQEKQTRDTYMRNVYATIPEREGSRIFQVLHEEHYNVNQVLDGLEEEVQFYSEQIKNDQKTYEKAYQAHDKKQKEYHEAKTLNDQFGDLQQKEQQLKEMNEQKHIFKQKEKQVEDAERASKIEPYEKQVIEWQNEAKIKENAVHIAIQKEKEATTIFEQVQHAYEQEKNKKTEREYVQQNLNRLQEFLPVVKEIQQNKEMLDHLKIDVSKTSSKLKEIKTTYKEKSDTLELNEKKIKKMERGINDLPEKQQQLLQMREQVKVLIDYGNLLNHDVKYRYNVELKKRAFTKLKDKYNALERAWLSNQASLLASHLHDGEPCPVCGSKEHPDKATTKNITVTKEQLETLKKDVERKESDYRTAVAELKTNQSQLKEMEKEVRTYEVQIDEVFIVKEKLIVEGKKLKAEVAELQKSRNELKQVKEANETLKSEIKELQSNKEQLEQTLQKQQLAYSNANATYSERVRVIPEDVRALAQLEKKIRETKSLKAKLEQAWEEAQQKLQQAQNEQTKASANLENMKKQLEETKLKQKQALEQFKKACQDAKFPSVASYHEAKIDVITREQMKQEIEQYKQNVSTLNKQVIELQKALQGKVKVDINEMNEQLQELKQAYEAALNQWNLSKKYYEELRQLIENIYEANEQVKETEKRLSMYTDLANIIRGQNHLKISFERFLQIDYLEQIIEAANHRLRELSNGQFMLLRSERQESYGRQSGLALDVYDAYTGQTRDVKTLSGGEKFNASLCLALGMSDVIQSFQGNVSIDTMFIDEGFGSLDEESLHKSIDTLIDLQQSGRMIGVISHVKELKSIFPAVLEVKKTKEGYSKTQFVIK